MKHLELEERIKIGEYVNKGKSLRYIAKILGRHHSTIKRELDRNTSVKGEYIPHHAHSKPSPLLFLSNWCVCSLTIPGIIMLSEVGSLLYAKLQN